MTPPMQELLMFCDEDACINPLREAIGTMGIALRCRAMEAIPTHRTLTRANLIGICFKDGLSTVAHLRQLRKSVLNGKVVAFIPRGRDDLAEAVIANGAIDFIEVPNEPESLRTRVRAAVRRDAKLCPYDIKTCPYDGESGPPLYSLTPRELEVAELMAAGHPSKRIGIILGISVKTVEVHRARVFEKTGTSNLPELTRLFLAATPRNTAIQPAQAVVELDETADAT
ncbi:MAG: LuxR C-terminal-related transcriptional regulator [Pseudomonadota bacterium]